MDFFPRHDQTLSAVRTASPAILLRNRGLAIHNILEISKVIIFNGFFYDENHLLSED